jgi:hypothetical protein
MCYRGPNGNCLGFLFYIYFSQWKTLGIGRACPCAEPGFSSKNGDRAWGLYYSRTPFCFAFFSGQKVSKQKIFIKKRFSFTVGSVCRVKRFTRGSRNMENILFMTQRFKLRRGSGWDNSRKTSILRVSTLWYSDGTSVSMLVEDMSRNKCYFPGSNITCFTFYIRLWPICWLPLV